MLIAAAALAGCGDDGSKPARASAATTPSASLDVPLKPRHGSKVSGTATLQTTISRTRLDKLQRRPYSINVHEPAGNLRPIACGDTSR